MAKYLDTAMWAKLSKNGDDWQWAIYNEMAILLCVLTDNGFCELAHDLWKDTGMDNQVDEHTHWLGPKHPNKQWLLKKSRSFEKQRVYQHVLKRGLTAVRPKKHRSSWFIRVEKNRWLGDIETNEEYVRKLCVQLNVSFDPSKGIVNLRG